MSIKELFRRIFSRKEIRFLTVGVINVIVGYGTYAFFVAIGVNYLIANVFSYITGSTNSYFWNKYFTFNKPKRSLREMLTFYAVYVVSFLVGSGALYVLVQILGLNPYVANVVNLAVTTSISWFGHSLLTFVAKDT